LSFHSDNPLSVWLCSSLSASLWHVFQFILGHKTFPLNLNVLTASTYSQEAHDHCHFIGSYLTSESFSASAFISNWNAIHIFCTHILQGRESDALFSYLHFFFFFGKVLMPGYLKMLLASMYIASLSQSLNLNLA
jgi:hypothetical protein